MHARLSVVTANTAVLSRQQVFVLGKDMNPKIAGDVNSSGCGVLTDADGNRFHLLNVQSIHKKDGTEVSQDLGLATGIIKIKGTFGGTKELSIKCENNSNKVKVQNEYNPSGSTWSWHVDTPTQKSTVASFSGGNTKPGSAGVEIPFDLDTTPDPTESGKFGTYNNVHNHHTVMATRLASWYQHNAADHSNKGQNAGDIYPPTVKADGWYMWQWKHLSALVEPASDGNSAKVLVSS